MKQPRIKNRQVVPWGGGWSILDPATGVTSFATQFNDLVEKMREVRRVNGVPVGLGFEDEVMGWCCRDYPDECVDMDPDAPRVRNLTLTDILNGTRVLLHLKLAGGKLVEREEAERRAQICMKCPMNIIFSKPCSGICPELRDMVTSIVGNQGTQYDGYLKSCSICGCFLSAAIWLPLETQCKGTTDQMKRQFANVQGCWKVCE